MKVLVTGGAGFIGSHIVDAYVKRGDEVSIVDDLSSGSKENIKDALNKGAKLYQCKLQSPEIREIVKQIKPDLINHHAAQKSVRDSVSDPVNDADINLIGLLNLLEAARGSDCKNIIFASSGGVVYGEQIDFPAKESHPIKPMSPYGVSKYASELYLSYYCQEFGFNATALRYGNIYGPRQDPDGEAGVIAIFSKRIRDGLGTVIFGSGKQTRDFVFVSDVVKVNLAVGEKLKEFQALNVGCGVEISIKEIHSILAQIGNYTELVKFEEAKSGEQMRSCLSYEAVQQSTGWKPEFSINEGLKKTYEWFCQEPKEFEQQSVHGNSRK